MGRKKKEFGNDEIDNEVDENLNDQENIEFNYESRFSGDSELFTDNVKVEEVVESELLTSIYSRNSLTDDEQKAAESINNALMEFIETSGDIEEPVENKTTLPTGIDLLDVILGGGLAMKLDMIVGQNSVGKSTLLAKIISTAQKKFKGKMLTFYLDSEESTTTDRLEELGVCNPKIIPFNNITIEKVFKILQQVSLFKKKNPELLSVPAIIAWDSLANTRTEAIEDIDNPNSATGLKARTLAFFFEKYTNLLNKYNIALLTINQVRNNIDIGPVKKKRDFTKMDDLELPGGKSMKHAIAQLLYISDRKPIEEYGFKGQIVNCRLIKNKLFTPLIDVKLVMSFQYGYSNFWTNYELLKEYKRINVGAWCSLISYPEIKFRQYQAVKYYNEDPKFKEAFDNVVKEVLEKEFIEKYKTKTSSIDIIGY